MTMPDRVRIPAAFWLGVDRLNIGRSALLREAGLPVSVVRDDVRISTVQFFALWRALETLGGSDVGLRLSETLDGSVMPPSFLVGYHAKDFGNALQCVARFKALCAPEELCIAVDGATCVITSKWRFGDSRTPTSLTDATMASLVGLARHGTGDGYNPLRIELRRKKSGAVAGYYGCPIRWSASEDRLILRSADLSLRFRSFNAELIAMLDAALAADLDKHQANASLTEQVRWLLRRTMTAGRPELRSIARELAISERSLQRRLNEEGHSFQTLLSDTRHRLAREHLANPDFEIAEIACMLGYDDQGSFYRAFHKWEGKTPSEWRDTHARVRGSKFREATTSV